jgi:short-subunit dehydrogenase
MVKRQNPLQINELDRAGDGDGKTALVTGASSGIGRALAELLAAKGYRVVMLARRRERLEAMSVSIRNRWGVDALPLIADLSDPKTPAKVVEELPALTSGIDLLVNNAGFSAPGRYHVRSWTEHERRLQVMGIATLELTHRLLPGMVERRWGRIINVASIAALFSGTPQDVVYGATKALVFNFSLGIDAEFRNQGIRCTVSVPGFTDTEIFDASGFSNRVSQNRAYRAAMMAPETVARQAYGGVMRGQPVVIHGRHHRALAFLLVHAPSATRRMISSALSNTIGPEDGSKESLNTSGETMPTLE